MVQLLLLQQPHAVVIQNVLPAKAATTTLVLFAITTLSLLYLELVLVVVPMQPISAKAQLVLLVQQAVLIVLPILAYHVTPDGTYTITFVTQTANK